jgi:hypothetical protein
VNSIGDARKRGPKVPDRICEVNMFRSRGMESTWGMLYEPRVSEKNRIGCFNPARWLNPFYDPDGTKFRSVWDDNPDLSLPVTGGYNYAQWLCTDHYDEVMSGVKEDEELDRLRRGIE